MKSKKAPPSEIFTAEEVSETKNERTTKRNISLDRRPAELPESQRSGRKIRQKLTVMGVMNEWKEMKNGAPGKNGVTIKMIRNCQDSLQEVIARKIVDKIQGLHEPLLKYEEKMATVRNEVTKRGHVISTI